MERRRIDALLADRGLAGSRTSAAASVRAGRVRIGRDGARASKPSQLVPGDAELLVDEAPRYVSRGGIKLENGLDAFGSEVWGHSCLDVGRFSLQATTAHIQHLTRSVESDDFYSRSRGWNQHPAGAARGFEHRPACCAGALDVEREVRRVPPVDVVVERRVDIGRVRGRVHASQAVRAPRPFQSRNTVKPSAAMMTPAKST